MTITVKAIEKPTVFISLGNKAVEITKSEAEELLEQLSKVLGKSSQTVYVDRIVYVNRYPQYQYMCGYLGASASNQSASNQSASNQSASNLALGGQHSIL